MNKKIELETYLIKALEFPKEIHLESSSRCNSHCITCPRDKIQRELGELGRNLFVKAVTETSCYDMDFIMLHLNGEPLFLDIDELVWRINFTRETNPKTKQINFFTNGSLLDEEKCDKILSSKLDLIVISIDGGCKDDYESIRRGLSWDILIKNMKYLVKRKKELKSKVYIQTAIIPQKANEQSVRKYFAIFSTLGVDHCAGSGVNNIGGMVDADRMKLNEQRNDREANNLPCFKLFLDLDIMSNGKACVCSQDVTGALVVGDLSTQTLKEIWQGKELTEIREKFIYGNRKEIPFCGKCDFMTGFVYPDYWNLSLEDWQDAYANIKSM